VSRSFSPAQASDVVRAAVGDLGVRRARLQWLVTEPVRLAPPAANVLRGGLGAALHEAGAAEAFQLAWERSGPPALWFQGWHGSVLAAGQHLETNLVLLDRCADQWPSLLAALGSLALGGGRVRLQRICWDTGGAGLDWPAASPLPLPVFDGQGAVVVEACTPLQLSAGGRRVTQAPPLAVLTRSAGERLRQLHGRWTERDRDIPGAVGALVRSSDAAAIELVPAQVVRVARTSGATLQTQPITGVMGAWRYAHCGAAVVLLGVAERIGVGKGTAFGCGTVRLGGVEWTY